MKMPKSEIDNSISEIKSNLEAINSQLNDTEEQISDLEDRIIKITQSEQQTERQIKKKKATNETYGIILTCQPTHIGVPEGGERERRGSKMYLKKLWLKASQT